MTTSPHRRRTAAGLAALAVLLAGCGDAPTRPIGVREYPADIALGEQATIPPPAEPPAAELAPAFPGFIAPPAPRATDDTATATTTTSPEPTASTTTTTSAPAIACPDPDPLAVPVDEAQGFVPRPPAAQQLPFRVSGTSSVDDEVTPLTGDVVHTVGASTPFGDTTFRFDVAIGAEDDGTVTTYQVDQRGVAQTDGVAIVQIRTTDQVATDAFTPSAPIRILPLPPVKGQRFSSTGADPIHATSLTIFGQVVDKVRVNACGTPLEAWQVRVGPDPQTGQPSAIRGPAKEIVLSGTYAIAPQFGGLVITDALRMKGTDATRSILIDRTSTTNVRPAGGKA
jgi:hypothetical protein